jgi:hypothetical protein
MSSSDGININFWMALPTATDRLCATTRSTMRFSTSSHCTTRHSSEEKKEMKFLTDLFLVRLRKRALCDHRMLCINKRSHQHQYIRAIVLHSRQQICRGGDVSIILQRAVAEQSIHKERPTESEHSKRTFQRTIVEVLVRAIRTSSHSQLDCAILVHRLRIGDSNLWRTGSAQIAYVDRSDFNSS